MSAPACVSLAGSESIMLADATLAPKSSAET
eukprot:CAMPEP_0201187012 /NCGR_PEP_ID=MMETSP0851-20130426/132645_1 /ASSEMBLY_ACC=CAM_ASM_000631 /TAXON_ID=183588 /ORGANISM="Pseudo-nitzschia fraudulenta, Strain WWA7" /LENGTH=30 /DNA_ID= /DNA_START= /DNA_END= /DNA_ORIENTATION=